MDAKEGPRSRCAELVRKRNGAVFCPDLYLTLIFNVYRQEREVDGDGQRSGG